MITTYAQKLPAWLAAVMLAFAASFAVLPANALADDEGPDTTPVEPTELQQRVEDSAAAYNDAAAKVDDLQARIEKNSARIAEIEAALPAQQARADSALVSMYKLSDGGDALTDVLMGARDLDQFMSALEYLSDIANGNLEQISKLRDLRKELSDSEARLLAEKAQAEDALATAKAALAEAQAAREEAAAAALAAVTQEEIDAMAAALADEAAAQALEEAQAAGASEEEAQAKADAAAEAAAASVDAATVAGGDVDWGMDKGAFVDEWAARIDEYLAGSPMEGQGSTFASAAWDYGVDPRWSPAIANTESTKGEYTFADYNAWGWGSESWDSWEDAINDHVKGLADGYGSTISQESAEKYCPPNADSWYSDTLSEMNRM